MFLYMELTESIFTQLNTPKILFSAIFQHRFLDLVSLVTYLFGLHDSYDLYLNTW